MPAFFNLNGCYKTWHQNDDRVNFLFTIEAW